MVVAVEVTVVGVVADVLVGVIVLGADYRIGLV